MNVCYNSVMGLNDLFRLVKAASAGPDKGEQAMAAAAQIAAKPVGSSATIKPIDAPAPAAGGPDQAAVQKQLDEKDKKIKDLERQNQIAQQNFDFQKMENEKMRMSQQIRDEERKSMEKIQEAQRQSDERFKQQQDGLDRLKAMAKAEEMQHKSVIQQQELQAQLKMQQEKNKVLMDVNNQGLKMQMAASERARAQADKYKDDARKQVDKEREAVQQYHQKQQEAQLKSREEQLKAREQASFKSQAAAPNVAAMSPALKHLMGSSIKSLGRFKQVAPELPPVGAGPAAGRLKIAAAGTENNVGTAGSGAPAPQPPGQATQQQNTPTGATPTNVPKQSAGERTYDPGMPLAVMNSIAPFMKSFFGIDMSRGYNPARFYAGGDKKLDATDYVRAANSNDYDPRMKKRQVMGTWWQQELQDSNVGTDGSNPYRMA